MSGNLLSLNNTRVEGQGGEFSKNLENWSTMLRAHDDHFIYLYICKGFSFNPLPNQECFVEGTCVFLVLSTIVISHYVIGLKLASIHHLF